MAWGWWWGASLAPSPPRRPAQGEPGWGRAAPVGEAHSWRHGCEWCQPRPAASPRRKGATRPSGRVSHGFSVGQPLARRAPLAGAVVAFCLFFPSWKLVKDSAEAVLDAGEETTWDTERGHRPPRGGSDELPGRECDPPALEHHPPSSHCTRGWQRRRGTLAAVTSSVGPGLCSLLPLWHRSAEPSGTPSTVSTRKADIPTRRVCGFSPEAFTATQGKAFSNSFPTHIIIKPQAFQPVSR